MGVGLDVGVLGGAGGGMVGVVNGDETSHLKITAVSGYFLQDAEETDPGVFDAMNENFGLIDQPYDTDSSLPDGGKTLTQWQRFAHKVEVLNEEAEEGTSFRVLYLGRHGQGFHNVAEDFYGTDAWDCYYSLFDSDPIVPSIQYHDAHLTKLGVSQAQNLSRFWSSLLTAHKTPAPQSYYTSPMTRSIQTANLTFSSLSSILPGNAPFKPIVKELIRETNGIHTCDSRSTKSYLTSTFPFLIFPESDTFTEKDELYDPELREPAAVHARRLTVLLDDVLTHDENTYISMTSHSGTIAATLMAIGHRAFKLPTGGAIPVLVKVTRVKGQRTAFDPFDRTGWEGKPVCHADPKTAGRKGYRDIGEYLSEVEGSVV